MTNYFGKGDTSTYDRESWEGVATPQDVFHTYTIKWTKDHIIWSINGNDVRTVTYEEAQGGSRFPQTPMNIRLGIWAGGAPTNAEGTIEWAGGRTDYSKGPYSMYIKSVKIKNDNPAESYTWSDKSGSSDSIKFTGSDAVKTTRSTDSATESSTTSESPSTTTESPSTTTESPSTTESSSAATTMATRTSSSSAAESTPASSSNAASPSSSASPSGSSGSGSASSSDSDSNSESGSENSSESSGPSSSAGPSASASASPTFNAAASVGASYLGPVSLLGLLTAMLQL